MPHPNTPQIVTALRALFPREEWAFLEQVANGTGHNAGRWADAVAMNLWPSRGMEVHGFEVKASRSDWKRELERPAKAEAIAKFCHRWWLVAGHAGIVQEGELPPTWGLMVLTDGVMKRVVQAPALPEPQPLTRTFVAAILRRAQEQVTDHQHVQKLVTEARAEGMKVARKQHESDTERMQRDMESLRKTIQNFGMAAGEGLNEYNASALGQLVRRARGINLDRLQIMRNGLAETLKKLDEALETP